MLFYLLVEIRCPPYDLAFSTSLQPSFMMLTKHLYNLFRSYIINGRIRAPPEFELSEMIATFQMHAKTHRRAVQSKFKNWAKRMAVENGKLVLANSRKLILAKEDCDKLIMNLHSDKHFSIEIIIFQVKLFY